MVEVCTRSSQSVRSHTHIDKHIYISVCIHMCEHMYVHTQKHEKSLALWERWTLWDPRQKSRLQKRTKTNEVSAKRPVEWFPETQRHCKNSALEFTSETFSLLVWDHKTVHHISSVFFCEEAIKFFRPSKISNALWLFAKF